MSKFDMAYVTHARYNKQPPNKMQVPITAEMLEPSPLKALAREHFSKTFCKFNYEWQKLPKKEVNE